MERSNINEVVRNQFNKQADQFSNWSVTQNKEYMKRYFAACEMTPEDSLLDVACGSGEFAIFSAPQIKSAAGVDISDRMIELARLNAIQRNISNITFLCHDIASIPLEDKSFSIVTCKSAFHHVYDYDNVMNEMIRCCENGGKISMQDIVAYQNDRVNDFFEQLEQQIDISHHVSLSKQFFQKLFEAHNLAAARTFELTVELNFKEYLNHAVQSEKCSTEMERLLKNGLHDSEISGFFAVKGGELYFKRNVFVIIGRKLLFV